MPKDSKIFAAFMVVCVVLCPSAPALAGDGLTLSPSTEWRLREYEDRCRASRVFGEGRDRTTLWIEQGGTESNFNLTLIGRPLRHPYGGGVHVQFGEEPEIIRSYLSARSSRGRPVLTMFGVAISQPAMQRGLDGSVDLSNLDHMRAAMDRARAGSITTLRLRTSIVEPIELHLGSLAEPLAFLDECGARLGVLLTEAGRALTPEATPPVALGDAEDWLTLRDFPGYLAKQHISGEITVRLTVNKNGDARSCFVVESNRPQLFDDAVCLGLLKRAEFEPARNAQGEPVASYYFYKQTFTVL